MALKPKPEFLKAVQFRVARLAAGPSTLRGYPSGTAKRARRMLENLPLDQFATRDKKRFMAQLERATQKLSRALPRGARKWGLARKLLNVFLRDSLYNIYLRTAYGLTKATRFYELPLDSITAGRLYKKAGPDRLGPWRSVGALTSEVSGKYQTIAAEISKERRIHRVDLDVFLLLEDGDENG